MTAKQPRHRREVKARVTRPGIFFLSNNCKSNNFYFFHYVKISKKIPRYSREKSLYKTLLASLRLVLYTDFSSKCKSVKVPSVNLSSLTGSRRSCSGPTDRSSEGSNGGQHDNGRRSSNSYRHAAHGPNRF